MTTGWALIAAGALLGVYQAWAIAVRWSAGRALQPPERRVLLFTLLATRGLGLLLGVLLIVGGAVRIA